jgi:phosphoglycerate dehydrogenase-like enzyme
MWLVMARNIFNRQLANIPEHSITRLLSPSNGYVTSGDWKAKGAGVVFIGKDAFKQTLGVIGAGGIGQAVRKRGLDFSMKLCYTGQHETPAAAAIGAEYRSLEPLLHESDHLVFTCALTAITKCLIGLDQRRLMKKTAIFMNIARGAVVVTGDSVTALRDGLIGGAALDVTDPEPLPPDHPLLTFLTSQVRLSRPGRS